MAKQIEDLSIIYDNAVEVTGKFYYKDELKIKETKYGPCASFSILVEKPRRDKPAKHYIFSRAFGDRLVEKLKRIEKGTFIRVIGELESGYGGTYVNVKIITTVSTAELEEMLEKQKEPEIEEPAEEEIQDIEEMLDTKSDIPLEEERPTIAEKETETTQEQASQEREKTGWGTGWKKKERRGIF